jgi:hypothetical protein
MTAEEYRQNVPPRQQAYMRQEPQRNGHWYALNNEGRPLRNGNTQVVTRVLAADLYTYLVYLGFSPTYLEA